MSTTTSTGLVGRLEQDLSLLLARAIERTLGPLLSRSTTSPPTIGTAVPHLTRELPEAKQARVRLPLDAWIGGEPEPLHVIGADSHG